VRALNQLLGTFVKVNRTKIERHMKNFSFAIRCVHDKAPIGTRFMSASHALFNGCEKAAAALNPEHHA
jgi:hypothetical protein